jgi:hypothetical protein
MESDDWVADVKRWYFSREQAKLAPTPPATPSDAEPIGYEAAHPALQSRNWPETPRTDFAQLK